MEMVLARASHPCWDAEMDGVFYRACLKVSVKVRQ